MAITSIFLLDSTMLECRREKRILVVIAVNCTFSHPSMFFQCFLIAQLVKNPPTMQETLVWFLGQEDSRRRDRLPPPVFLGFPYGSAGKESTCHVGDLGSIPGLGRPLEKRKATHSSILAWRIPWTIQSRGCKEWDMTEWLSLHFTVHLQCCVSFHIF